jgi:16S rRNA (cytidine1402-2'-O)-methyltransferase
LSIGKLYLIATPIGNLQDITVRAIRTLHTVDIILCEDVRSTQKLLRLCGVFKNATEHEDTLINKVSDLIKSSNTDTQNDNKNIVSSETHTKHYNLYSYHDYTTGTRREQIIQLILNSPNGVAIVSDAGSPLISDPGYKLICDAIDNNISVESVPGACSVIAALSVSGLPTDTFFFYGFVNKKITSKQLKAKLHDIKSTIILFESAERLVPTLKKIHEAFGDIPCTIARELTKKFEEILRGNIMKHIDDIENNPRKGEVIILINSNSNFRKDNSDSNEHNAETCNISVDLTSLLSVMLRTNSVKNSVEIIQQLSNETEKLSKKKIYDIAIALDRQQNSTKYRQGVNSEETAVQHLLSQNYNILGTRVLTPYGEIDIIAKKENYISFIEVKSSINIDNAAYAITDRKKQRIVDSANFLISQNNYAVDSDFSFDAVLVSSCGVSHIQNAWED